MSLSRVNLNGRISESGTLFSIVAYSETDPKNRTESIKFTNVGSSKPSSSIEAQTESL